LLLKAHLKKIDAVKNNKDLEALAIEMEAFGGIGFFGANVGADAKNSNRNVLDQEL
jgi:endothelin-converting enzyme/putative endopeptidase